MATVDEMANAVIEWFDEAPIEAQKEFLEAPKNELIAYHHTLGRNIRNEYKLWQTSWTKQIDEQGIDNSPDHPDAVSMRVIEAVWEKLNENS